MDCKASLKYLRNKNGTAQDKSLHEEILAKNLDFILQNNDDEFFKLNLASLFNIFNHPNRKLFDHNLAYRLIIEHYEQSINNTPFVILLETLDGSKLSKSNLNEAILQKKRTEKLYSKY